MWLIERLMRFNNMLYFFSSFALLLQVKFDVGVKCLIGA